MIEITVFILVLITVLAGLLIFAPVVGLRLKSQLGIDGTSFSTPGTGKDPIFVVLMMASAEGFDRNQEDDRRSAKKALQP